MNTKISLFTVSFVMLMSSGVAAYTGSLYVNVSLGFAIWCVFYSVLVGVCSLIGGLIAIDKDFDL